MHSTRIRGAAAGIFALLVVAAGLTACQPVGPVVEGKGVPVATAGRPYRYALRATGGTPPYSWSAPGGVREGLTLRSDGVLFGTPVARTRADIGSFMVRVADAAGRSTVVRIRLHVQPLDALRAYNLINDRRVAAGLPKLGTVTELSTIAARHAAAMARALDLVPEELLDDQPPCTRGAAQVVARGDTIVDMFDSISPTSDTGRRILGEKWTNVGVGVSVASDERLYVAIHFLRGC